MKQLRNYVNSKKKLFVKLAKKKWNMNILNLMKN